MSGETLATHEPSQSILDQFGGVIPPIEEPTRIVWERNYDTQPEILPHQTRINLIKKIVTENGNEHLLLRGSGFDVLEEIRSIIATHDQEIQSGESEEMIKQKIIDKITQNLRGFYWEFLVREPLLPNILELTSAGIVASKYGNRRLVDVVNSKEREGAYKRAVEQLDDKLGFAQEGTIFLYTSPAGWTGITDERGNELTLPESQTYLFQIKGNQIYSVTMRTSMTLLHHLALLEQLGEKIAEEDETVLIKRICSTVVNITDRKQSTELSDVLSLINKVMNSENIWYDQYGKKIWRLEEINAKFRSLDHFRNADSRTEQRISDLQNFLHQNLMDLSAEELVAVTEELGRTAIEIKCYLQRSENYGVLYHKSLESGYLLTQYLTQVNYQQESREIQNMPGCKGIRGGSIVQSPFGPREITTAGED